ncbi:hypothetical protein ABZ297_04170 [Nonomuraea sp. NPDC005983]|uniref:hypothetical protein n=1 Tax=Nonomuraea sp. NPDC005983 TaxID=3155595 RepID=UPI0033A13A1E
MRRCLSATPSAALCVVSAGPLLTLFAPGAEAGGCGQRGQRRRGLPVGVAIVGASGGAFTWWEQAQE